MKTVTTGIKKFCLLLLLALNGSLAMGQQLALPKNIEVGKLANGMTYYLIPNGDPGKVVVKIYTNIGAFMERPDQHGYAHIIEHMLFQGSEHYPKGACLEEMELMGMRIALDYNAFTGKTDTQYFMTIPENDKDYFSRSLGILKDWMFYLKLDEEELENEKKVIVEEINRGGNSATSGSVNLLGTSLEGHDVLGTKESVRSATSEGLYRFYKDNYVPENMAVIVYGKMDQKFAETTIRQIFGDVPANTSQNGNKYLDVNSTTVVSGKASSSRTDDVTLAVLFKTAPVVIDNYPAFKQDLIDGLLCDMFGRRLENEMAGSISNASVNIGSMITGNSIYNFRLKLATDASYETVLDQFCRVLAQAMQHGFSQDEINYYSKLRMDYFNRARLDNSAVVGSVYKYFRTGDIPMDSDQRKELTQRAIQELSPDDFSRTLSRMLELNKTILFDSTVTACSPEFNADYILGRLSKLDTIVTEPFVFERPRAAITGELKPVAVQIAEKPLVPVKNRRQLDGDQLVELSYPNGVKVVLFRSGNENAKIKLIGKNGLKQVPEADREYFGKAIRILNGAYGKYDSKEAHSLEQSMRMFKNVGFEDQDFELSIGGKSDFLEQMVQVFNLVVTETNYPEDEAVREFLDKMDRRNESKKYPSESPATADSARDDQLVQRLCQYDRLLKENLSNSIIYIEGDLPENMEELVSKYIGSLVASTPPLPMAEEATTAAVDSAGIQIESWKRDLAKVVYAFNKTSSRQLTMRDELVLQGALEHAHLRMVKILREKYGMVYATGKRSAISVDPVNSRMLRLAYMTDTANAERSYEIMANELLKPLSKEELTDTDVAKVRAMLRSLYVMSFYEDDRISDAWLKSYFKYGKLYSPAELDAMIKKLSKKEFESCLYQMIDLEHCFRTTFWPER
ncbi:M16 family metallopeptidase [Mangrovibacterium diazotrophicum]|uniref:Putative Zn-dependent peptidase n=1 Tax=Mangrovibacterium diazotrophicum TaxID=1261403 RepID=A0A419W645_9BACT|nr:M16 family metallopeptidase [Mangrovibacterium diazotrophicum]RKD90929.1 putative Zn-dependent peptidase [Mangrovibacterium diazotrophicum]